MHFFRSAAGMVLICHDFDICLVRFATKTDFRGCEWVPTGVSPGPDQIVRGSQPKGGRKI
jgi:hypothetical protein